jgi:radical SAM superfamily enzyme YgiQ (UPF0313 family)
MSKPPFILLVNPWITDFAAHDLWAKPMGLLLLGALLRDGGCGVGLIDCLNRHDPYSNASPDIKAGKDRVFGTGNYPKIRLEKPPVYAHVPRHYHRYGIHPESFIRQAAALRKPDLIWVTSHMTYWYPGTIHTIALLRELFPTVSIWLGGIYATLCHEHAEAHSGADQVISGRLEALPARIEAAIGVRVSNGPLWSSSILSISPALDLLPHSPTYAPLLTSLGCPFRCPYCASSLLQPVRARRSAEAIFQEILQSRRELGVSDFAFYDDALLLNAETTLRPALERIAQELPGLRFHTPNALHVRALTREWCDLLFASGFRTLRLGLETTRRDRQRAWGGKVEMEMFMEGVENLLGAGFSPREIGVYLLAGLPGQSVDEVREDIQLVQEVGVQPYLSEYSPVPGTDLWQEACRISVFDLAAEPLTHNNTFLACRRDDFTLKDLEGLKAMARSVRQRRISGVAEVEAAQVPSHP